MSYRRHRKRLLVAACTALLVAPATAVADDPTTSGGASAPETPTVTASRCDDGRANACAPAGTLTVEGEHLEAVERAVFLGRRGRRDNRAVTPTGQQAHQLSIRVPKNARSGPVQLLSDAGRTRTARVRLDAAPTPASRLPRGTPAGFVFPIAGKHQIGTTSVQRFGGARNHRGQDVFAECGTPIVAATSGTVKVVKTQSAAGNYAVIEGTDGRSYVSMHMLAPSTLRVGDPINAGDAVGQVGETGRATGCHLHFEIWTAPGWYTGGEAIDPYTELRSWEAATD